MAINATLDDKTAQLFKFPKLMKHRSNGAIIMATSIDESKGFLTGMVLKSSAHSMWVGYPFCNYHVLNFEDFHGTLILSNK